MTRGAGRSGCAARRQACNGILAGALLLLGLATGCDSPTIPGRDAPYDFRLRDFQSGESWVLRWQLGRTIRVFVAGGEDPTAATLLESALREGAELWNRAVLFGEFRLEPAARVEDADVVLMWSNAAAPVDTSHCPPNLGGGRGVTTFCLSDHGDAPACSAPIPRLCAYPLLPPAAGPSGVRMVVVVLAIGGDDPARVRRIVAHELGHVVGIATHSPARSDIMWDGVEASAPSLADRATVQVLYHTPPDILP